MGSTNKSQASFDIKIIGAGVAGLAAGLALSRKGHQVTILESKPDLSEFGAGIQLWANATRILCQWGLEDEFLKYANEPRVMKIARYANGAVIGEIPHNPQNRWEYGFPHWQVYRPDLQMLLGNAAKASGVKIAFNSKVKEVNAEKAEIILADGSIVHADLIVAADGISSRIREMLPSNAGVKAISANEFCFRAIVPKAAMDSDPETAELMQGEDSMAWLGPGVAVLGYTVSGGRAYNALISCPKPCDAPLGRWGEPGDVNEARGLVREFCPAVKKIWSYVDNCAKWTLGEVPPIQSYASDNGRLVLIGDCAHAIVPHAGQGGNMALEDGASLAEFVSLAHNVDGLASALKAFEAFRRPRIDNVRQLAHGNQKMLSLQDGPAQEERDRLFAGMTKHWKGELETLGEEGYKAKARPEAKPGKDIRSPESRQYLSGYDIFAETAKFIDNGCQLS